MINEKQMYAPEEVVEIAKSYRALVINLALGPARRKSPLEKVVKDYQSNVPENVHNLLDVKSIYESFNHGKYEK